MTATFVPSARRLFPLAVALVGLVLPAAAQPVPALMNYQGRLTDNSPSQNPITQMLPMTFRIYDAPSPGGSLLWSESWGAVDVVEGIFSVLLGSNGTPLPASIFTGGGDRFLELEVAGEILLPRQQLGSVGFAGVAERAADSDELAGLPAAGWQQRVSGSCAVGSSVRAIAANGTVTCETDDVGIVTEADPHVSTASADAVPRWDGAALVDGAMRDDGFRVGVNEASPDTRLQVTDGSISIDATAPGSLGALWFKTQHLGVLSNHQVYLQGDPDPALQESLAIYHRNATPEDVPSPGPAEKLIRFQWDGNVYLQGSQAEYRYESPRVRKSILGASSLRAEEDAATARTFTGSTVSLLAGYQYMLAPLPGDIPDGARLLDFKCTVIDATDSYQMAINLFRASPDGSATEAMTSGWCYSGSATGCASSTVFASVSPSTLDSDVNPAYAVIDRDQYSYAVSVWTSNTACAGACVFYSCEFSYEVDRVD